MWIILGGSCSGWELSGWSLSQYLVSLICPIHYLIEATRNKLSFYRVAPTTHWENYISISIHIKYDDRGDSFPFDLEPNGFPFVSKSKGKLSPRSYPIQCERKWKYSFLSVLCVYIYIHIYIHICIPIYRGSRPWHTSGLALTQTGIVSSAAEARAYLHSLCNCFVQQFCMKVRGFLTTLCTGCSNTAVSCKIMQLFVQLFRATLCSFSCNQIDFESNGRPFAVPNHSVHGKYNLISIWFNKISLV